MNGLEIILKGQLLSANGAKKQVSIAVQDSEFSSNPGDADNLNPGCVDLTFVPDDASGPVTLRLKLEPFEKTLELLGDMSSEPGEDFDGF